MFGTILLIYRGCGGIGRHDGLKIRCLVIVREGSSPSVPIIQIRKKQFFIVSIVFFQFHLYKILAVSFAEHLFVL